MSFHGPCPVEGCALGLVLNEGIHLSPICPAHGAGDTIAAILSGLAHVRADIATDEDAARSQGFDGIAHAYALAGARIDGAIRGIEISTSRGGDPDAVA